MSKPSRAPLIVGVTFVALVMLSVRVANTCKPTTADLPTQPTGPTEPIAAATDRANAVQVTLWQAMDGPSAVETSRVYRRDQENAAHQNKQLYYFEVEVHNLSYPEELVVLYQNWSLLDQDGRVYSPDQTSDYVRGRVHAGHSTRGGVMFLLHPDSRPARLVYDTGLLAYGYPLSCELLLE